jgi:transcriptional regulator with XRE-family HTH domain
VIAESTIGEHIHLLRRRSRLSLRDLAKQTGVSAATIGRIEAGQSALFESVVSVARALGVSLDDLADRLPPLAPREERAR